MQIKGSFSRKKNDNLLENKNWEKFFGTPIEKVDLLKHKNKRIAPLNILTYVLNCNFINLENTEGPGGAINWDAYEACKLLVELSTFKKCSSSSFGGAINQKGGSFIGTRICSINCSSYGIKDKCGGHFNNIIASSSYIYKNELHDSSVADLHTECDTSPSNIRLSNGAIVIKQVNSTNNYCAAQPAAFCFPSTNSGANALSVTYSTFTNETSFQTTCIYLWAPQQNILVQNVDIIDNKQNQIERFGAVFLGGYISIKSCCIKRNNAKASVYIYTGTVTFDACSFDFTQYKIQNGFKEITGQYLDFTNEIDFIKECYYIPVITKMNSVRNISLYFNFFFKYSITIICLFSF